MGERRRGVQAPPVDLTIESLDAEARGIARRDGKVIFVEGALAGERVIAQPTLVKPSYEIATMVQVLKPSALRTKPRCPSFGVCGGCAMQHLHPTAQLAVKQRVVEDALWHLSRLKPHTVLPALGGPAWGYRHRARLTVRHVAKKGGVLVGFHEKGSSFVADMGECHVLPPHVGFGLRAMRAFVESLSIAQRLPQIEVAVGDNVTVLVLRILEPMSAVDVVKATEFAQNHGVQIWVQSKGPDTIRPLAPAEPEPLVYRLPEFGISMRFAPAEFTQVNFGINRALVARAMRLLDPQAGERVWDLFCGLGNFTLPIARSGAHVVGVEGSHALVKRAYENAAENGLADRVEYQCANLFEATPETLAALGAVDKVLIDPPREGAVAVVQAFSRAPALAPKRIVYVSCNPATLARDAAILVHEGPYELAAAGAVNMFPHTAHVESIAVFQRRDA